MPERFDHAVDLSTPPEVVRWDLGERSPAPKTQQKICGLRLGEKYFAVPARHLRGLREIDRLTPVPLLPRHVLGVTSQQGTMLPVLDAGPLLGVRDPRPGPPWTCLWLDGQKLGPILLAVDEILAFEAGARVDLDPTEQRPPGEQSEGHSEARSSWSAGEAILQGRPMPLLDILALLEAARPAAPEKTP